MSATKEDLWPALPYEAWKDTYATLHMWSQVIGKITVALAPPINHSWGISLHLTARGLATRNLPYGARSFTMEFDFIDHRLLIRTTDGDERALALRARSVADFYREVIDTLNAMAMPVKIRTLPVEIPAPIRFEDNRQQRPTAAIGPRGSALTTAERGVKTATTNRAPIPQARAPSPLSGRTTSQARTTTQLRPRT